MIETEVKILEIDKNTIERRLLDLGATRTFDGDIHALYYDLPDNSLRSSGKTLRLRKEGSRNVLTLKLHISSDSAKQQQEYETEVADFDTMRRVIKLLGYHEWLDMKKHRTSYLLSDSHIDIDKYEDEFSFIPVFLEIEAADVAAVYKTAAALGFRKSDCMPWDAVALAEHYRNKK